MLKSTCKWKQNWLGVGQVGCPPFEQTSFAYPWARIILRCFQCFDVSINYFELLTNLQRCIIALLGSESDNQRKRTVDNRVFHWSKFFPKCKGLEGYTANIFAQSKLGKCSVFSFRQLCKMGLLKKCIHVMFVLKKGKHLKVDLNWVLHNYTQFYSQWLSLNARFTT